LSEFYPLLGRARFQAGVEQLFGCLIVQNRQGVQSMGRSRDWTFENIMVDGFFFCATLTGRRGGHPSFVQTGAETFDTGAEAVKPDPRSSWEGHSERGVPVPGIKMRSLVGGCPPTPHSIGDPPRARHLMSSSDELMSCCAARRNGRLDLRRRASALDGRVSAEWSRCPGSMARRARDSVVQLRRSSAGWMPSRIGRLSAGAGLRYPVTIRKASLMAGSMRRV